MSRGIFLPGDKQGHDAEIPGGYRETMLPARTRDREGMIFGRMKGRAVVLIIAELFTGRLWWGSPCLVGRDRYHRWDKTV